MGIFAVRSHKSRMESWLAHLVILVLLSSTITIACVDNVNYTSIKILDARCCHSEFSYPYVQIVSYPQQFARTLYYPNISCNASWNEEIIFKGMHSSQFLKGTHELANLCALVKYAQFFSVVPHPFRKICVYPSKNSF